MFQIPGQQRNNKIRYARASTQMYREITTFAIVRRRLEFSESQPVFQ